MSQLGRRDDLLESAEAVCRAIMEHAKLLAEGESPTVVVPARMRIKELGEAYGATVSRVTGWSNPLQRIGEPNIPAEDELEVEPESDADPSVSGAWVSVIDQNAIVISDAGALEGYIRTRSAETQSLTVEGLKWLCEQDGWKPSGYPGVRLDWRSIGTCVEG